MANKLSESYKVLLLEHGGNHPNFFLPVPCLTYFLHGEPPIDWKWTTVPQKKSSFGLNNNVSCHFAECNDYLLLGIKLHNIREGDSCNAMIKDI